ncbi:hypothetical protein C8Q74DRAFT_393589 [Fomes fomentarius]|nr:hypothetical protein C8Q74DRAFT_393589 [Fomes fomentarius]
MATVVASHYGEAPHGAGTSNEGPLPSPHRDAQCLQCLNPSHAKGNPITYSDDASVSFCKSGDIVLIHESAHSPIDQLFAPFSGGRALKKSTTELLPGRPALLWRSIAGYPGDADMKVTLEVSLMTTYHATYTYAALPKVLHTLVLPISPHFEVGAGIPHVHTLPEWRKLHGWFIALRRRSACLVLPRRWEDSGTHFQISQVERIKLYQLIEEKFVYWMGLCDESPELVEEYMAEYNVSLSHLGL